MDGEFEKIKSLMPTVECNTTAAKEHVSEAERMIRTVKEKIRGLLATLPFSHVPKRMKIDFIYFVILWLNAFSVKSGISQTISPRELLMHWRLDYKKHCRVQQGTYCEVHDEPVPTNTVAWRFHEAIALGPTGNLQGSVKFYCINNGRVLKCRSFTPMPMPDRVIKQVNKIGEREREGQGRTFHFLNRQKQAYEWTDEVPEDDDDFQGLLEDKVDAAPYPDISAELPGVELDKEEREFQTILDEPEPDFRDMATAAQHNAGIDGDETIRAERARALVAAHAVQRGAAVIEADENELVNKITFEIPDEGVLQMPLGEDRDDTSIPVIALDDAETHDEIQDVRCYPTRARRSVVGNQPYDTYTPRTSFLQLGEVRAHRSVLEASHLT
jgi:hypothetical protein